MASTLVGGRSCGECSDPDPGRSGELWPAVGWLGSRMELRRSKVGQFEQQGLRGWEGKQLENTRPVAEVVM